MAQGPKLPDFGDFSRLFANLTFPAMPDATPLVTATRRNMEVFAAANRIALEGAQAVARRHAEIMQQSMAEMTEAMRALSGPEAPADKARRQADLLKQAYEHAVANMGELHELMRKSHEEAMDLLARRFAEAMEEIKALSGQR